ncbi:Outer membrane porin protein 32 [Paraburkholderia aspalathi]|uniref:porin n=1 Tax=Paraburkholderia aspalathi TaxID=1324617 RepID=UPI00190E04B9|nr:porin [Paraburkholderia aspalathi]MBK3843819.1 porin [Paraburkholderia aspalathi]CAE6861600.1 Outer membrane porin protein 32 [Paraburkholderia aspalathi]CAE6869334.1 Outer membrane porin protein 32 [Paraburkholderia aspalathi]
MRRRRITPITVVVAAAATTVTGIARADPAGSNGVSLYGIIDAYVGSVKTSGGSPSAYLVGNGGMTTSFWGMRGSEDLGGGYRTLFALESYFQPQNGQAGRSAVDAFFSHSAFVGVAAPFGTLTAGQQISPFFRSQTQFSPFGGSTTLNPLLLHSYRAPYGRALAGDDLISNALVYASPSVGGFSTMLAYAFGNVPGAPGENNVIGTVYYENGPFASTIGVQRLRIRDYPSSPPSDLGDASNQLDIHVGLSYDLSLVKGFLEYQRSNNGSISRKDNIVQVGGTVRMNPSNWLLASWARNTITGSPTRHTRDTASIAYDYLLSKRSDVYVAYQYDKADGQGSANSLIAGLRHKF